MRWKSTKEVCDWAYLEILKAQDRSQSLESVASRIVLVAAKWGGDNVRASRKSQP